MSTIEGMTEYCDECGVELETGQIGFCDECQRKQPRQPQIEQVTARIVVDYDATGLGKEDIRDLRYGLSNTIIRQIGAGLLTGHTNAPVETYEVSVSVHVPPMWFVCAEDEEGENFDLIVRAADEARAKELWIQYFKFAGTVPTVDYIGRIPETVLEGAIDWNLITGHPRSGV